MNFRCRRAVTLIWLVLSGSGVLMAVPPQIPAGTELQVRLASNLSSSKCREKDKVEGMLIAPAVVDHQILVPAGKKIYGVVRAVRANKPEERALLLLEFDELEDLGGRKIKISTQLTSVDNAREVVDEQGQIIGILASDTMSAKLDQQLGKLGGGGLAGFLGAAKQALMKEPQTEIDYPAGTEVTVKLIAAAELTNDPSVRGNPWSETTSSDDDLVNLVNAQPFQTVAEKPPNPSDITSIMFIGSREHLEQAFKEAGWSSAAKLTERSELETVRAIAEGRGYKEAPMSVLLLDGNKPDLVFQKQNNTFAKRHHLRIFHRRSTYRGREVWVSSATHDIGIDFSAENRTFIHKVDSSIDREREKVVNDLLLTSRVTSVVMVERPDVPKETSNATGDKLVTDGRMVVLILE